MEGKRNHTIKPEELTGEPAVTCSWREERHTYHLPKVRPKWEHRDLGSRLTVVRGGPRIE